MFLLSGCSAEGLSQAQGSNSAGLDDLCFSAGRNGMAVRFLFLFLEKGNV